MDVFIYRTDDNLAYRKTMSGRNSKLFRALKNICLLAGIWSDRDGHNSVIYFKTIQVIYVCFIIYMMGSFKGTLELFKNNINMFGISMICSMSAYLNSMRFYVMKKPKFQQLIKDIFQQEKFLANHGNLFIRKQYEDNANSILRLVIVYQLSLTFSAFTVFSLSVFAIIAFWNEKENGENASKYVKFLVGSVHIPFNISDHYIQSHIMMNIFLYFNSFMVCSIDLAFMIPIWYIRLKLKVLRLEIKSIMKNVPGQRWNVYVRDQVISIVKEHQKIIHTFRDAKDLYWNVLLVATLFYGFQFAPGFLGFLYLESWDLGLTISIGGICYVFSQLFVLHWQSQLLTDESVRLATSVYFDSEWYRLDLESRKSLHLMILRAQKPLELTCGPLYPLNLNILIQVLKRFYTFINIFKKMN